MRILQQQFDRERGFLFFFHGSWMSLNPFFSCLIHSESHFLCFISSLYVCSFKSILTGLFFIISCSCEVSLSIPFRGLTCIHRRSSSTSLYKDKNKKNTLVQRLRITERVWLCCFKSYLSCNSDRKWTSNSLLPLTVSVSQRKRGNFAFLWWKSVFTQN